MANRNMGIGVTLTDAEFEQYTLAARMMNKTKSRMIREAIEEYLKSRNIASLKKVY